jgi:hypothetical protein
MQSWTQTEHGAVWLFSALSYCKVARPLLQGQDAEDLTIDVVPPASAALGHTDASVSVLGPTQGTDSARLDTTVLGKLRGRLRLRTMANSWRRKANDKALPALRPFIPRLLRDEMLQMAQWCAQPFLRCAVWLAGCSSVWHGLPLAL